VSIVPVQPYTLTIWPFMHDGFTKNGIYVAHHHGLPTVLAYVKTLHPSITDLGVGDVVVYRQHHYETVSHKYLLPLHVMHYANVRAVIENYGSKTLPMRIVPKNDRVVVVPKPQEDDLAPGIVRPEIVEEVPQEGTVYAVGPGRMNPDGKRTPMGVEPGEIVMFTKYSGSKLLVDGHEYLILGEKEILVELVPEV
jgi:chaperonin GroES